MRNLKKFFALVLAMLMIVSAAAVVSADDATFTDVAEDSIYADAIADLVVKGITAGTGNGEFAPENGVKRYEMAIFVARAATGITDVAEFGTPIVPFEDVTEYTGAIYYAYANGIVNGYSATKFGPDDAITYVQALKMAVAALGYEVEWEGDWKWPYYNKAVALGLTDGVAVNDLDKALTRAETAQIIYNMIYAAPADGELTLADKNFGSIENGVGVESTFVITATPKQAYVYYTDENGNRVGNYTADGNAIGDDHVGIQALVNGVPTGAITYLPAVDLGIAEGEDLEDYFNRAVTLINYDAETVAFDDAKIGDAPVVVNYNEITRTNGGKSIKVGENTYKLVTSLTDSYLNNEIVVFDSSVNAATSVAMELLKDEAGNIVDEKGNILAKLQVRGSANYYVYAVAGKQFMINEVTALEKFGYEVIDAEYSYIDYSRKTAVGDVAYELHLYDDDKDNLYERAIYLPIYISNYYATTAKDFVYYDATGAVVKAADVTYNTDVELTTGTVFTFTYNKLLKEITVNEVIEPETKVLKKVQYENTTSNDYIITFTDGSTYRIDKTAAKASSVELGGELLDRNEAAATYANIKAGKYLGQNINGAWFVNKAKIGKEYVFYANNGFIFFAEATVAAKDPHEYIVFEGISDIDLDAIYADLWFEGAYKAGATVSQINAKIAGVGDKAIEKLNAYQLSLLLGDKTWQKTNAVWATQYADGQFNMRAEITKDMADYAKYDLIKLDDKTIGTVTNTDNKLFFVGGHTIYDVNRADIEPVNRLYTDSETVFYFVNTTGATNTVKVFKTMPSRDAYIELDAETVIYTDALGRGYGAANTVIVFDGVANGFVTPEKDRFFTTAGVKAVDFVDASLTWAENLGLTGYEEDLKLYAYEGAHDLEDGSKHVIYSTFELAPNTVYKVDKNGVVGVNAKGEKIADTKADLVLGVDYGTYKNFANTNGILYAATSLRDFYAYFIDGRAYVELGEAFTSKPEFPHTIIIDGSAFNDAIDARVAVSKLIAIDANTGTVYENAAAAEVLNTPGATADYDNVYWLGTRDLVNGAYEYDDASFEDGVAVFVFD